MRSDSPHNPMHEIADRLLDWHDQARLAGRDSRANVLLNLAGHALGAPGKPFIEADQATVRQFRALVGAK
jgi:hypothetical protein